MLDVIGSKPRLFVVDLYSIVVYPWLDVMAVYLAFGTVPFIGYCIDP